MAAAVGAAAATWRSSLYTRHSIVFFVAALMFSSPSMFVQFVPISVYQSLRTSLKKFPHSPLSTHRPSWSHETFPVAFPVPVPVPSTFQ